MIPEKIKQEILRATDKTTRDYLALHLLSKRGNFTYDNNIYMIKNYKAASARPVFPIDTDYTLFPQVAGYVPAMQAFADDNLDKEVKVHYDIKEDVYYLSFREHGFVNYRTDNEKEVIQAIRQYQLGRLRFNRSTGNLIKKSISEVPVHA